MYQRVFGSQTRLVAACAAGALAMMLSAGPAAADTAKCIETISKATAKYEVAVQKAEGKCEDGKAKGKVMSCPDSKATDKITGALSKLQDSISGACTGETPATIGFTGLAKRCDAGVRVGLFCAKDSDCEGQCGGGGDPGGPCTSDANCPAACVGGSNPGESCKGGGATQCANDGGTCTDLGHCNNPAGGHCSPADRCPAVADDSAPFTNCDAAITDIASVTSCIACNANSDAGVITGFAWDARRPAFGTPGFGLPDDGDKGKSVLDCDRTLGKAVSKYFQSVRKATQKCTDSILKGKPVTCPDSKLTDALSKAKTKLTDAINKKCSGTAYAETAALSTILSLDPLADSLTPLPNSGAAFGDTASNLANKIASCSDGFAVPSSIGGCQTNCGNGQIDPGEDCDDGNVVNGDICPADCHLNTTCSVTGTVNVQVDVAAPMSALPLGALQVYLAYDDTKVNIPGTGSGAGAAVSSGAFSVAVNDLDSAIRVLLLDPSDIGTPPLTVEFNICSGATVTASDFNCMVESAADAATATTTFGVSCSVSTM